MNTQTKHTPDSFKLTPWRVQFDDDGALGVWTAIDHTPGSRNNYIIAEGIHDEYEARLLASAPEMAETITRLESEKAQLIETLKRFVSLCPSAEGLGGHAPIGAFSIAADYARAAIANATGKVTR